MDKLKNFQILKLLLIASLLIITPVLSSPIRPTYLYFVVNILIIVVGAESGLLSFFSRSADNKKPAANSGQKLSTISEVSFDKKEKSLTLANDPNSLESAEKRVKVVGKCLSEKVVGVRNVHNVKRSPSSPSIFFIGGVEAATQGLAEDEVDDGEEIGELSGQELFHQAEDFIGNFYKQLKMQREESWKKLHNIYQKAF